MISNEMQIEFEAKLLLDTSAGLVAVRARVRQSTISECKISKVMRKISVGSSSGPGKSAQKCSAILGSALLAICI